MKVLEAWLDAAGGRGVMLTFRRGEWHADAVVPDDDWPPAVESSGGPDVDGMPSLQEALESLSATMLVEASRLIAVHREEAEETDGR